MTAPIVISRDDAITIDGVDYPPVSAYASASYDQIRDAALLAEAPFLDPYLGGWKAVARAYLVPHSQLGEDVLPGKFGCTAWMWESEEFQRWFRIPGDELTAPLRDKVHAAAAEMGPDWQKPERGPGGEVYPSERLVRARYLQILVNKQRRPWCRARAGLYAQVASLPDKVGPFAIGCVVDARLATVDCELPRDWRYRWYGRGRHREEPAPLAGHPLHEAELHYRDSCRWAGRALIMGNHLVDYSHKHLDFVRPQYQEKYFLTADPWWHAQLTPPDGLYTTPMPYIFNYGYHLFWRGVRYEHAIWTWLITDRVILLARAHAPRPWGCP